MDRTPAKIDPPRVLGPIEDVVFGVVDSTSHPVYGSTCVFCKYTIKTKLAFVQFWNGYPLHCHLACFRKVAQMTEHLVEEDFTDPSMVEKRLKAIKAEMAEGHFAGYAMEDL